MDPAGKRGHRRLAGITCCLLIASTFATASARAAEPLRGEWHLDGFCGAAPCTEPDSSGNGLGAQWVGSNFTNGSGRFGSAYGFPSESSYLDAGDATLLQPSRVSLVAWVRAPSTPPVVKIVAAQGAQGGCSYSSYALYTGGSAAGAGGLRFYVTTNAGSPVTPPAPNTIWDNQWHMIAGTYDGSAVRLYVDGAEVGSTPQTGNITYGLAQSNHFTIGSSTDFAACTENMNFSGNIDETRVYSRALTASEVKALASDTGPTPPELPSASPTPTPANPVDPPSPGNPPTPATTPTPANPPTTDLPPPVLYETANAEPVSGTVLVSLPVRASARAAGPSVKGRKFIPLRKARQVPVGSIFDTKKGTVRVATATAKAGIAQTGAFYGGFFQLLQRRGQKSLTDMRLTGGSTTACAARKPKTGKGRARIARKKKPKLSKKVIRSLRGDVKGRFRTTGQYAAATVRGTKWTMQDRCDGTLTRVTRGTVIVRNLRTAKQVTVKTGKSFLVRRPG